MKRIKIAQLINGGGGGEREEVATNHGSSQDLDNPLPDLSQTKQDMEDPEAAEGGALTVTCTCGNGHADPLLLMSAHCGTSQHAACYKILLQAEVRT